MAEDNRKMPPALHSVDDGHEHRLQNLEHAVGNLKTDVAENKLTLQYVGKEVQEGFNRFSSQLEAGFGGIQRRLDEGESRMNAMGERIGEHARKFDRYEDEKRKSSEKWDAWKKWVGAAVTGAIAIGLKELVAFIAHHL